MLTGDRLLAELALGGRLDQRELTGWLAPLGIGEHAAVLAFGLSRPEDGLPVLEQALRLDGVPALATVCHGLLCAIVACEAPAPAPAPPPGSAVALASAAPLALATRARAQLSERLGEVHAAASRAAPSGMLAHCFAEARAALDAARSRNGDAPEVACYEDLGALKLLLSVQSRQALESYCQIVLGPVEGEGGEYGEELLRSADTFIEHNGHWEHAARALYCHRHTLRYRIRRVEQLTERDLSRARDRIELWLALRGRELVR